MPRFAPSCYTGHRFPPGIISQAIWLYFRFPLSLRMVEEMLAARGIVVSPETVRDVGNPNRSIHRLTEPVQGNHPPKIAGPGIRLRQR